jgi:transposase
MEKVINLSPEERIALIAKHRELRKIKGNTNLAYRVNAILLLDDGLSIMEVAGYLFLDDDTIRGYVGRYLNGKDDELSRLMFKGRKSFLSEKQKEELFTQVDTTIFLSVLPIIAYVKDKYGVSYSESGMTNLLHELGFSYKKPKLVGAKANEAKQEAFIKEFDELMSKIDLTKEQVLFADAVHPQHNTEKDYGWIRTSEAKYIKSNTGRDRVNILAAIDIENKDLIYQINDTINAISVIDLLKEIEIKNPDKETIYFISDNARYFYAEIVKEYLNSPGCRIKMVFLPAYSPNLNIIERLWSIMRKKILSNQYYEKFAEFKNAVVDFLENCWSKFGNELDKKLNYNFHKLPKQAYA